MWCFGSAWSFSFFSNPNRPGSNLSSLKCWYFDISPGCLVQVKVLDILARLKRGCIWRVVFREHGLAGREDELADLVERIDKTSTAFGMQINAEKTTLMTNNTNGFSTDIRVNGKKLDCVNRFKYLGAIITDEGSKPEILARIA